MIDINAFTQTTFNDPFSTAFQPIPEGEYVAMLSKMDPPRAQKDFVVWDLTWEIDDADLKKQMERDRITARQSIFLELTANGNLDTGKGKNVALGRLREALGQNTPGQPWSPSMLQGKVAKIRIKNKIDDNGVERSNVASVASL